MSAIEKEFVTNKAATAGQITLSTAVFGRGTDFFCKDEGLEKDGGVHIIQVSVIFGGFSMVEQIFYSIFYFGFVNLIYILLRHFFRRK